MENKKLTSSIPEELNEEELSVVSGGIDNNTLISVALNNPDMEICTVCGKLKKIEYYYHEKRICGACLESTK